jgi:fluoroacetyl-CoA thioesterase
MKYVVGDGDTAASVGSGDVEVLATPRLIAWMEAETVVAAASLLQEGQTSVGTSVRVNHRKPTPVGGVVDVTAQMTSSKDATRLTFTLIATDNTGAQVADGEIDRAVVDRARFFMSANSAEPGEVDGSRADIETLSTEETDGPHSPA